MKINTQSSKPDYDSGGNLFTVSNEVQEITLAKGNQQCSNSYVIADLRAMLHDKRKIEGKDVERMIKLLPVRLQKAVQSFDSQTEQIMVMMSSLVCAGSLMPKVYTYYHAKKTYASLYVSIVAPAASNKGAVNYSKVLVRKVHKYLKAQSDFLKQQYDEALKQQKQTAKKGTVNLQTLKPPPYYVVTISGDITSAKLIQQLSDNQGLPCILIEDEMDAVVLSGSGEHGKQLNRIFRNVYHHAPISQQRKGDNQHYEIDEPFMSMIMAGTPDQFRNLLGSYQNGLSSRFTVLVFNDGPVWMSPAPCEDCPNRDDIFEALSEDYFELWQFLRKRNLEIRFTKEQWDVIDEFGQRELSLVYNFQHETLAAVVKRTSLQVFRLAMILTAFRVWENSEEATIATCSDTDFTIAFCLIQHAYLCGIEFFKEFQGKNAQSETTTAKKRVFNALSESFTREDVLEVAQQYRVSVRSADGYIKDFRTGGLVDKIKHGHYIKKSSEGIS